MNALKRILTQVLLLAFFARERQSSLQFESKWVTRTPDFRMFGFSVYIRMSRATDKFCTGTLVDERWVLTASRCMFQVDEGRKRGVS